MAQILFRRSSRELKRLDSISRSPVFAHLSETIVGMTSVRAYHAQDRLITANRSKIDRNTRCSLMLWQLNRWLAIRLGFLGALVTLAACVFAVLERKGLGGAAVGLSITYALQVTGQLNMIVRMLQDTENAFNSVERISFYINETDQACYSILFLLDHVMRLANVTLYWAHHRKRSPKVKTHLPRNGQQKDASMSKIWCSLTAMTYRR